MWVCYQIKGIRDWEEIGEGQLGLRSLLLQTAGTTQLKEDWRWPFFLSIEGETETEKYGYEKNIDWLPPTHALMEMEHVTELCALDQNWTPDPSVYRLMFYPEPNRQGLDMALLE